MTPNRRAAVLLVLATVAAMLIGVVGVALALVIVAR